MCESTRLNADTLHDHIVFGDTAKIDAVARELRRDVGVFQRADRSCKVDARGNQAITVSDWDSGRLQGLHDLTHGRVGLDSLEDGKCACHVWGRHGRPRKDCIAIARGN